PALPWRRDPPAGRRRRSRRARPAAAPPGAVRSRLLPHGSRDAGRAIRAARPGRRAATSVARGSLVGERALAAACGRPPPLGRGPIAERAPTASWPRCRQPGHWPVPPPERQATTRPALTRGPQHARRIGPQKARVRVPFWHPPTPDRVLLPRA